MKLYARVRNFIKENPKTVTRGLVLCFIAITTGGIILFSHAVITIAVWKQYFFKLIGVFIIAIVTVLGTYLGEKLRDDYIKPRVDKCKDKKAA